MDARHQPSTCRGSNDPNKLAYFTGFYKSIQSAGSADSWRADACPASVRVHGKLTIQPIALVFALPMIYLRAKDHTGIEDEALARMDDHGHVLPASAIRQPPIQEKEAEGA
ncbi:hypothetical protein B0H14DRAFT_2725097 [Mycena olivaceomarginata]|nr:hypothetical protein B0H14DRAFT_2725097 [Mycena olivaceomarginata]